MLTARTLALVHGPSFRRDLASYGLGATPRDTAVLRDPDGFVHAIIALALEHLNADLLRVYWFDHEPAPAAFTPHLKYVRLSPAATPANAISREIAPLLLSPACGDLLLFGDDVTLFHAAEHAQQHARHVYWGYPAPAQETETAPADMLTVSDQRFALPLATLSPLFVARPLAPPPLAPVPTPLPVSPAPRLSARPTTSPAPTAGLYDDLESDPFAAPSRRASVAAAAPTADPETARPLTLATDMLSDPFSPRSGTTPPRAVETRAVETRVTSAHVPAMADEGLLRPTNPAGLDMETFTHQYARALPPAARADWVFGREPGNKGVDGGLLKQWSEIIGRRLSDDEKRTLRRSMRTVCEALDGISAPMPTAQRRPTRGTPPTPGMLGH